MLTSSDILQYVNGNQMWYLMQADTAGGGKVISFIEDVLTFIILYNNLIPIS